MVFYCRSDIIGTNLIEMSIKNTTIRTQKNEFQNAVSKMSTIFLDLQLSPSYASMNQLNILLYRKIELPVCNNWYSDYISLSPRVNVYNLTTQLLVTRNPYACCDIIALVQAKRFVCLYCILIIEKGFYNFIVFCMFVVLVLEQEDSRIYPKQASIVLNR